MEVGQPARRPVAGAGVLMRVLMLSDVYFPRVNGVSTSIQTFVEALQEAGDVVRLVVPRYGPDDPGQPNLTRIPSRGIFVDPEDRMMKWRSLWGASGAIGAFDIVHVQTPFVAHYAGVRLARRHGVPVVVSYHTYFEEYLYNYIPLIPKRLLRYAARRFSRSQCASVDGLIVPSQAMLETLRGYGVSTRAAVIATGIDAPQFERASGARFRQRYGIPPGRPTLVFVSRVAWEKNIGFLIDVLARVRRQIPDVLLIIAGEGPAESGLRRKAATLNLTDSILFVGYQSREQELQDCYAAGDVFVFASRTETQGLVLLEAMACGVPVVSTAVMGTNDIISPQQGAVMAEEDVEDFSGKVVHLLSDPDRRRMLGTQARAFARAWSAEAQAQRLATFYRDVCIRHRDGAI